MTVTVLFLFAAIRAIDAGRWRLVQSKENSGSLAVVGLAILFAAWMLEFIVPTTRLITWGIVAVGLGLITANLLFDYRRVG